MDTFLISKERQLNDFLSALDDKSRLEKGLLIKRSKFFLESISFTFIIQVSEEIYPGSSEQEKKVCPECSTSRTQTT